MDNRILKQSYRGVYGICFKNNVYSIEFNKDVIDIIYDWPNETSMTYVSLYIENQPTSSLHLIDYLKLKKIYVDPLDCILITDENAEIYAEYLI